MTAGAQAVRAVVGTGAAGETEAATEETEAATEEREAATEANERSLNIIDRYDLRGC